jgi:energy-coupling factor transporter ATP-binding protein EcfA2
MNDIHVRGYGKLPHILSKPEYFFLKTTILYGISGTGKTTIVKWILSLLKKYIPNIIIIAPTDAANKSYVGVAPDMCIKYSVNIKDIKDIIERQKIALKTYNKANDIQILKKLYMRTDRKYNNKLTRIVREQKIAIRNVDSNLSLNSNDKITESKKIQEKTIEEVRRIYKKAIHENIIDLNEIKCDLTSDEQYSLKFLYFNPSLLLLMDDCGAEIKKWGKKEELQEIFFQGRHTWITSIYTLQTDGGLLPSIRTNAFVSIFTDANSSNHFFANKANSFSKEQKKKAESLTDKIFESENDNQNNISRNRKRKNFKRLVYNRSNHQDPFTYIEAPIIPRLKFGSSKLWEFCTKIPIKHDDEVVDETSQFYNSFSII